MTVIPFISNSCVVPWPLRAAELVLRMVIVEPEMEMGEVKSMSVPTTQVLPSVVAQEERSEKVLMMAVGAGDIVGLTVGSGVGAVGSGLGEP